MPTYDYQCSNCDFCFDKLLKVDERNIPENEPCPNCSHSKTVSICLSAPSLMSPFRVDGLKKPASEFKERMNQIKHGLGKKHNLKDHY